MKQGHAGKSRRVFVGMSGGVDSSVSAALLKRAGYDVTGVFIKVWQPDWIECDWRQERLDAMRAAAHLDIPFVTLDLEKEYKEGVIDYMIREYSSGRTPNPDVMCNREVKFGAFWKWAEKNGADFIATGHYAINDGEHLFVSKDSNKDQTYFLWTLSKEDLSHVIFPIGDKTKDEVRKLAKKLGLPNAEKKDSQGLCFIGKIDVKEFLRHYIESKPGIVLDESGKEIGTHSGALLFTMAERHGFTITKKTPNDRPSFVVGKDIKKNTITVSTDKKTVGDPFVAKIEKNNWVAVVPGMGTRIQARSRYREVLQDAVIETVSGSTATIKFDTPQETLTSGQSLVVYLNGECLGGGIIN